MKQTELMGLFETQEYLAIERHEWIVPSDVKDKVAKMVQKYNERAIKKGYVDSLLDYDEASSTLSGIFVPKKESKSFFGQIHESGKNADLVGDIRSILLLCTTHCAICKQPISALSKTCPSCNCLQFTK